MKLHTTPCCAIAFLSGLSNKTTNQELQLIINEKRKERKTPMTPDEIGGQTAIIATTGPHEVELAKRLAFNGFILISNTPRRTGYPEGTIYIWKLPI